MLSAVVRGGHALRSARLLVQQHVRNASNIKMPSLSPTMTSGTIVKWHKAEGEEVAAGDMIAEIQTDKAVVGLEADEDGVLAKILVQADTGEVDVGQYIAVIADPDEDWKSVDIPEAAPAAASADTPAAAPAAAASAAEPAKPKYDINLTDQKHQVSHLIGPSVRVLLHEYGVEPTAVKPSGPRHQLTKQDVLDYIESHQLQPAHKSASAAQQQAPAPAASAPAPSAPPAPAAMSAPPTGPYTDVELSNMRKVIAKRLTQSKQQVPHSYATEAVRMNECAALRQQLKQDGVSVTVNDFIIKASAAALVAVPAVNSQWQQQVVWQPTVDVSVAVATPSGLITPIVPNADQLGLQSIADKVRELAGRAKQNKLQLHEFQGGTFTVSNLGMMGISEFTAIINPPQAAILAIGGAIPTLSTDFTFDQMMQVTLCYDSRVVSEAEAARWLRVFRSHLETPELLLSIDPFTPYVTDRRHAAASEDALEQLL